jgi:hypothetical protein
MKNDTKTTSPTHIAYSVRDYEKNGTSEADWTRIGAAWLHRDGDGFDIRLEAIPVSGRVTLRKHKPKAHDE